MTSRGKLLLEMALKKNQQQKPAVIFTDINNNETKTPSKSEKQVRKTETYSKVDSYRITGGTVINVDNLLRCDEELDDAAIPCVADTSANISSECQKETECAIQTLVSGSDENYDSDDSVRDPDWMLEEELKRKRVTLDSSDSDDLCAEKAKPKKSLKNHKTLNTRIAIEPVSNEANKDETDENSRVGNVEKGYATDKSTQDHLEQNVDHEEEVTTSTDQSITCDLKRSRAKKGMGDSNKWLRNVNKKFRMEGKAYKGVKRLDGKKKTHCIDKGERMQGERMCSKRCKTTRKCFDISDEHRKEIFKAFWERMGWGEKKSYVICLVNKCEARSANTDSRRKFTYRYYFRDGENKVLVCKDFFLSTLGIGEHTVYEWLKKTDDHGLPIEAERAPVNIHVEERIDVRIAREFLEALPKMPSHYCRSTSSKLYLEPVFTSFSHLCDLYQNRCIEKEHPKLGRKAFQRIFDKMNVSLFRPKKDQCDLCVGYETQNVNEQEYTLHISRKNAARDSKNTDKQRALETDKVKVLTMDVQSVLLCPKIEANAMYYKTKLSCHNFTVYDLATKHVICYFWHEGEAGLTANSFASCINNYIECIIRPDTEEIVLYSDGCGYQNRNATMSNTLLRLAVKHKIIVKQNFLEKGHTQMEVDSVHSTIERCIRRQPIYSPANYLELFRNARTQQPYQVMYLDYKFFGEFSSLKYYDTIRPGNKVGDPLVTDIRCLRYLPEGIIQYKLSYNDEFIEIPKRRNWRKPPGDDIVASLYWGPLPIKGTKYQHLQQLKSVIPKDYHPFYDALLHDD